MGHDIRRITIMLPDALLAAIDAVVRAGAARSRSAFVAEAVRRALATIENAEIMRLPCGV